jgi:hypothetical protein
MEACKRSNGAVPKPLGYSVAGDWSVDDRCRGLPEFGYQDRPSAHRHFHTRGFVHGTGPAQSTITARRLS